MLNFGLSSNSIPIGTIVQHPSSDLKGYLLCNGASPSRLAYKKLFAVLGSIYGAPTSTNFKLPDFRGRFIRGAGGASAAIGIPQAGGAPEIHGSASSHNGSLSGKMNGAFASLSQGPSVPASMGAGFTYSFNFAASRANALYGAASEIRPVNHSLNFFIKY